MWQTKVKMKLKNFILAFLVLTVSCAEINLRSGIQNEYEKLAEENNKEIVVNEIEVLKAESVDFEKLAEYEIVKMERRNELLEEQLKLFKKKDSLLNVRIERRKCLFPNASTEWQLRYSEEMKTDSLMLEENHTEESWAEIKKIENEIKILNIYQLARLESILNSNNLTIKHKIDIEIEGKRIVDTLRYISFNNRKLTYLSKNLFIEK